MYSVVGSFYSLPGKLPELIALLHEARTLSKKINDVEATLIAPIAGKIAEVHYVYQVKSLDEYEKSVAKTESNDEYKKLYSRFAPVVVPNTSSWQIYGHV